MKPSKAATMLGIAPNTIRLWSINFANHLSTAGSGGGGVHRDFDDLDMRVLYFIKQQKDLGRREPEILDALQVMQNRSWNGLPFVPEPPPVGQVALVPSSTADEQVRAISSQLALAQDRLRTLEMRLEDSQQEAKDLNRQVGELEGELKTYREAKGQQDKLLREVGELEGELRLWRSGRLKPDA